MKTDDPLDLPRDSKGRLMRFTSIGCYPIAYLDRDNCTLCPKCAQETDDDPEPTFPLTGCFIHWEGDPLICEECNDEIESAYGPVEEDTE